MVWHEEDSQKLLELQVDVGPSSFKFARRRAAPRDITVTATLRLRLAVGAPVYSFTPSPFVGTKVGVSLFHPPIT